MVVSFDEESPLPPAPGPAPHAGANLRVWPTRDLVLAYKGALLSSKLPDEAKFQEVMNELRRRPSSFIYPYTKGPDIANDGLGYGESVSVTLACLPSGQPDAQLVVHTARRTRSGLTTLEERSTLTASASPGHSAKR
jgi:hypothetical protein